MAKTAQLGLPLVAPSQAQKHVTVNEALARLDATAQLRVISSTSQVPPVVDTDGASYLIPAGATGEWLGKSKQIAIWSNGGWVYISPKAGWRAWDESRNGISMFDGTEWISDAVAVSPNGAAMIWKVVEFDHIVTSGSTNSTTVPIPKQTQVIGISGRVLEDIKGTSITAWQIGVSGAANRYGSGLGLLRSSYVNGLSGAPVTYYSDTPLLMTAVGGTFTTGKIRLALNLVLLVSPRL